VLPGQDIMNNAGAGNALYGDHVLPSVHDPVLAIKTIVRIFIEVLHKELISKHVFHENWHSDNRTLFKGVNEFLPILSIFLDRFG